VEDPTQKSNATIANKRLLLKKEKSESKKNYSSNNFHNGNTFFLA
jgi:hypothetical protein